MAKVILVSSDKKSFKVDVDIAKMSGTIRTLIEEGFCDDEGDVIPLPTVRGDILKLVIKWAEHHREDEDDQARDSEIPKWDKNFLKIEISVLFELVNAANYLDIKGLLDVTTKAVANMIKAKKPEEIRRFFNIKKGFYEDEDQTFKKYDWVKEK